MAGPRQCQDGPGHWPGPARAFRDGCRGGDLNVADVEVVHLPAGLTLYEVAGDIYYLLSERQVTFF